MPSPDYLPTASLENLQRRARILRQVRGFFDSRGYWEVETPILSRDIVVDRHLDPLVSSLEAEPCNSEQPWWYLQTSPEFAMKRLLVAGAEAIYQIARVFRRGESGQRHNPEFTMLEWYRVGDQLREQMAFTAKLVDAVLGCGPAEELTYQEAFLKYANVDPLLAATEEIRETVQQQGILFPESLEVDDRDGWLDLLLTDVVQPQLVAPTILYNYPPSQAALAEIVSDPLPVAKRFEFYWQGIELANGYQELRDPEELRRRNSMQNTARRRDGKETLPEESRLLQAMQVGLPSCAGVALGFDRLVMAALGAKNLREVIAFPIERA